MANYEKMYDLFDLAFAMQETSEGLSLEDIEQKYNVSRRTAERMRNALMTYFPQMEEVATGERTKRWRITQRSLNSFISFSAEELAVFKTAIDNLKQSNLKEKAETLAHVELNEVGDAFIQDALGCFALAHMLCMPADIIVQGLQDYKGIARRFVIDEVKDSVLVDDYAHHPTAIRLMIDAVRKKYPKKKILA